MKNNYLYALNSKGINNLNYILEDGRFYKNDNDIEYDGAISLDDNKISLVYHYTIVSSLKYMFYYK